jgi:hypothetical protein
MHIHFKNFDESCVIGRGACGTVYRAILKAGQTIAAEGLKGFMIALGAAEGHHLLWWFQLLCNCLLQGSLALPP